MSRSTDGCVAKHIREYKRLGYIKTKNGKIRPKDKKHAIKIAAAIAYSKKRAGKI